MYKNTTIKKISFKLLVFAIFVIFLYSSGIYENAIGFFPDCIGVCNNPGNLHLESQMFLWLLLVAAIILFYDVYPKSILDKFNKYIYLYCFLLLSLFLLIFVNISWQMDSDDRWILYRISKNVLQYGLHFWNHGELINVTTPLVWPYIASISHLFAKFLNIQWDLSIKLLGISIFISTSILILTFKELKTASKIFIFFGFISYFPLLFWSISGLETGFACFFIIFVLYRFYVGGFNLLNWSLYCLIIFIRPEFILAPFLSMIAFFIIKFEKKRFLYFLSPFLCGLTFVLLWLISNKFIWDDYFPTPFYLKSLFHSPFSSELTWQFKITNALVHYFSSILQSCFLVTGLLIFLYTLFNYLYRPCTRIDLTDKEKLLFILLVGFIGVASYHIVSGYIHMSYVFRYFVPGNIALIILFGLLINEKLDNKRYEFLNGNLKQLIILITLIQLTIFTASALYVENVEMSLTRAKHRDAFSSSAYSAHMTAWKSLGEELNLIRKPDDRLWTKDGTNIAGGALSNMYSLDGYYTPLSKSKFKSIRDCKDIECAKFFNYIMVRGDDPFLQNLSNERFTVIIESTGTKVIRNNNPEF